MIIVLIAFVLVTHEIEGQMQVSYQYATIPHQ